MTIDKGNILKNMNLKSLNEFLDAEWYSKKEIITAAEHFHFMNSFSGYNLQDFIVYLLTKGDNK